jgi:PQQ-dependent dehydrogenase (methanol/ethanol family)
MSYFRRLGPQNSIARAIAGVLIFIGALCAIEPTRALLSATPQSAPGAANWKLPPGKDFPLSGGNWGNQRYSTLNLIDVANIKKLGAAWSIHLEDGKAGTVTMEATPVVVDGVMYITTGLQSVFAIDAKTGAVKWKYVPEGKNGPSTNRGVVVAEGKVFTAQRDNKLVALDQQTGKLSWSTRGSDLSPTSAAPAYWNGLVYIGTGGARGQMGAYEAATGKEVWKFWTTPSAGERGSETWEGDSWKHGGGPIWTHPAIDPDLGMIYLPIGNAVPETDGEDRGGDNLYTASVVALDLKTGAYKWHFQEVHHDLWDYDSASSPVLADITYKGQPRKILISSNKSGYLYILDRTNGKPLIGIEEKPVPQEPRNKTAATQPIPTGDSFVPTCPEPGSVPPGFDDRVSCVFGAFWDKPVFMAPGSQGGNPWAPMTFDPQTRLIYVPGAINNSAFAVKRQLWDEETQRLKTIGSGTGYFRPGGQPRSGRLTAIDPTTNKIVWQKRMKFPIGTGSGLLSTAGGLLFHGESDGNVVAYDIKNGDLLWKFQTDAGADAPVSTYEVGGEQYVAILSGGNRWQLSQPGDSLWVFKLGGKLPQATPPPEPSLHQPGEAGQPSGR